MSLDSLPHLDGQVEEVPQYVSVKLGGGEDVLSEQPPQVVGGCANLPRSAVCSSKQVHSVVELEGGEGL